jgi:hypothetical protein
MQTDGRTYCFTIIRSFYALFACKGSGSWCQKPSQSLSYNIGSNIMRLKKKGTPKGKRQHYVRCNTLYHREHFDKCDKLSSCNLALHGGCLWLSHFVCQLSARCGSYVLLVSPFCIGSTAAVRLLFMPCGQIHPSPRTATSSKHMLRERRLGSSDGP